jgi:predicted proteasome-type protease
MVDDHAGYLASHSAVLAALKERTRERDEALARVAELEAAIRAALERPVEHYEHEAFWSSDAADCAGCQEQAEVQSILRDALEGSSP